jgi:TM2 domain-containing membrane protein YozV
MKLHQGKPVYKRLAVFFISLFFGIMGIDRMYLHDYTGGLFKFATLGGLGIWYFLDLFKLGIGEKLGNHRYWWSCELETKYNCQYENDMILKALVIFACVSFIIVYVYGSPTSSDIMTQNDPYEETG